MSTSFPGLPSRVEADWFMILVHTHNLLPHLFIKDLFHLLFVRLNVSDSKIADDGSDLLLRLLQAKRPCGEVGEKGISGEGS